LGRNELTEIKASTFRGLRRLRKLKLHENEIREVWPGAFLGLDELKHLDLSGNTGGSPETVNTGLLLEPSCFAGLGKLRELKLGFNYLHGRSFVDGTFEGLDRLNKLDLKGMYCELGCVHAFAAGLSTTVACSDKYNYDRTEPFFAPGLPMDYAQAVSYCTDIGGEIAVINNADENELARQACGQSKCWVGLEEVGGNVDTPTESQIWRWRDGSEATYVNWRDGHPRNYKFTYCDKPHFGRGGSQWCKDYTGDKRNAVMFCGGVRDNECNGEWMVYKIDYDLEFEEYIPEELEYRNDLPNSDRPKPLCRMY